MQVVRPDQVLKMIEREKQSISEVRVYYNLRRYQVRRFQKETVETVRYCLALDRLGLPITVRLLRRLTPARSDSAIIRMLHTLGDKRVLVMRKTGPYTERIVWRVNPAFKQLFQQEVTT